MAGVKYLMVPNFMDFSWMTVATAVGQMFYSLSIAMGILFFVLVLFAALTSSIALTGSAVSAFQIIRMPFLDFDVSGLSFDAATLCVHTDSVGMFSDQTVRPALSAQNLWLNSYNISTR